MKAILQTLATVVGIPTLVASLYFGLFASDIYVSEARVAVRSAGSTAAVTGLSALLATPALGAGAQNSVVVMDYAQSLDLVDALRERVDIVAHYSDAAIDPLARLDTDATREELLAYYRKQVDVHRDAASDVITFKVRAFEPQMAQRIATEIITLNEVLVNRMSQRMEEDALQSARAEMERAVDRVRKTVQDISAFQSSHDSVSPSEESTALFSRVASIEARMSEVRAELDEKRAFMRDSAPEVIVLRNRLAALEKQLALEKGRVTQGEDNLGSLMEQFQPLQLEQEIARQQYAAALASFEAARVDAQRQKQYLITFVEPGYPEESTEPRRLRKVLTVSLFAFLSWLIGGLLWSALRDHINR